MHLAALLGDQSERRAQGFGQSEPQAPLCSGRLSLPVSSSAPPEACPVSSTWNPPLGITCICSWGLRPVPCASPWGHSLTSLLRAKTQDMGCQGFKELVWASVQSCRQHTPEAQRSPMQ